MIRDRRICKGSGGAAGSTGTSNWKRREREAHR
jgi:hypothetical protein